MLEHMINLGQTQCRKKMCVTVPGSVLSMERAQLLESPVRANRRMKMLMKSKKIAADASMALSSVRGMRPT
jgi:hypothetical protein